MTLDNDGVGNDNLFGCLRVGIHSFYMPDIFLQLV